MASKGSPATRLQKELADLQRKPMTGVTVSLGGDNVFNWKVKISGPPGTPYEGGIFTVSIDCLLDHPHSAPEVAFDTKIYHPNIHPNGDICIPSIANWKPTTTIRKIIGEIIEVLTHPNADSAANDAIGGAYKADREGFEAQARQWTAQYAH